MTKTITKTDHAFKSLLFAAELLFILVVPIQLYGWLLGLLIHSGLSSLLHIAGLVRYRTELVGKARRLERLMEMWVDGKLEKPDA